MTRKDRRGLWEVRRVIAVVAMVSLAACSDGPAPTEASSGEGDITGGVAFVKTGSGVPNLVVALLNDGRILRTAHTDEGGSFSFGQVPEGSYSLRLSGFELAAINPRATAFDPIEAPVTVSGDPVDVTFAAVGLIPPRVVGTVTCDGREVVGARLRVVGGVDTDRTVDTDVRGVYAVTNVSEGTYGVQLLEAPCEIAPDFKVVTVGKGQAGDVDFAG